MVPNQNDLIWKMCWKPYSINLMKRSLLSLSFFMFFAHEISAQESKVFWKVPLKEKN